MRAQATHVNAAISPAARDVCGGIEGGGRWCEKSYKKWIDAHLPHARLRAGDDDYFHGVDHILAIKYYK